MTNGEWKVRLKPAGVLLACYIAAPLVVRAVMGAHDAVYDGFTFSNLIQAGLGAAVLYQLFELKEPLMSLVTARLELAKQPPEATRELAEKVSSCAGYISAAALLLPPLDGMFPKSWLMSLVRLAAVAYTVYMAYVLWRLSEPFLADVPPPPPPLPDEPPAGGTRRCPNCGQLINASMKVCAFCKQPIQ